MRASERFEVDLARRRPTLWWFLSLPFQVALDLITGGFLEADPLSWPRTARVVGRKSGEVIATYEYEVGERGDALLHVQALEAQLQILSVDEFRAASRCFMRRLVTDAVIAAASAARAA